MNTTSIKGEITKHIKKSMGSTNPRFGNWYVGITNDIRRRKMEHQNNKIVKFWKCYDAGSMFKANEVERYFHEVKGTGNMPSANGAIKSSRYVYVFRIIQYKSLGLNGVPNLEIVKSILCR